MHGIDDRRWLLGSFILLACSAAPRLTASSAPAVVARMPDAKVDATQPDPNDGRSDHTGVEARYIFDRNRLQDSRRVGRFLMALTDSGHLLRFDAATFALVGERVARRRVTCLGPEEEGGLLAALDDGTIVRINAETFLAERVGKVPGRPVWLGQRPSTHGLVVAYGHVPERFYGYGRSPQEIRIIDLTSGRTWKPNRNAQTGGEPTTFLLDRHDRLWVGTDHGEWGGRLEVIDLQTGLARDVPSRDGWSGVFGLVELSNGQVWAYGGTAHLFCTGAFITRVDGGAARRLYDVPFCQGQGRRPEPRKSANPVTQIVELDRGRVLIFAYGEVSISDLSLKNWRPFTRLKLRYQPGRPDTVSSYPAVRAIHVVDAQRPRLVLATARDGYAELDPSGLHQHALAEPKVEDVCSRGVGAESFSAASDGHAQAMHRGLPFFGEQEVLSLAPCQTADVLVAIENGGVALVSLAPHDSPLTEPQDELSRTGEPSREQTVIAHVPWIRDSDLGRQQRMEKAFWQLVRETADFVEARQLGRYGGVEYAGQYAIFFHGPDAEVLAAGIAPMLSASEAVSALSLVKRFGPSGSLSVVQVIKPKP